MWIYKNQKSKIVDFEIVGDNEDFLIHLDKENLIKEGKDHITSLLMVLQTYKTSGANERAAKFYAEYSEVSDFFLKVRDIVVKKKKPRRIELNNNLVRYNEKCIESLHYPENFEGIARSYADRYPFNRRLYDEMKGEWDKYKTDLRV